MPNRIVPVEPAGSIGKVKFPLAVAEITVSKAVAVSYVVTSGFIGRIYLIGQGGCCVGHTDPGDRSPYANKAFLDSLSVVDKTAGKVPSIVYPKDDRKDRADIVIKKVGMGPEEPVGDTITGRVIAADRACVIDATQLRESCVGVRLDDRVAKSAAATAKKAFRGPSARR